MRAFLLSEIESMLKSSQLHIPQLRSRGSICTIGWPPNCAGSKHEAAVSVLGVRRRKTPSHKRLQSQTNWLESSLLKTSKNSIWSHYNI